MGCVYSVRLTEKIIGLKGKYRLVVKEDGAARITHEDEVYVPEITEDQPTIYWKQVFANDQQPQAYFIGARIVALRSGGGGGSAAIDLIVAVWENGAYASHTVTFVKQKKRQEVP